MPLDMASADGDFVLGAYDEETNLPVVRRRVYLSDDPELQRFRFHACAAAA